MFQRGGSKNFRKLKSKKATKEKKICHDFCWENIIFIFQKERVL